MAKNILGTDLEDCCLDLATGFFRDGSCDTCDEDLGMHTVCAEMTEEFLVFSKKSGNDLSTPREDYDFPGLKPGDRWCICLPRWIEALEAGVAPNILPRSTHESALEYVALEVLEKHAIKDG
jgi:uncharacterized protein